VRACKLTDLASGAVPLTSVKLTPYKYELVCASLPFGRSVSVSPANLPMLRVCDDVCSCGGTDATVGKLLSDALMKWQLCQGCGILSSRVVARARHECVVGQLCDFQMLWALVVHRAEAYNVDYAKDLKFLTGFRESDISTTTSRDASAPMPLAPPFLALLLLPLHMRVLARMRVHCARSNRLYGANRAAHIAHWLFQQRRTRAKAVECLQRIHERQPKRRPPGISIISHSTSALC
jgi:hypothetical protein